MRQFVLGLILVVTMIPNMLAQKSLSDYSFVVVPERFDISKEDDQYQLNSMTKFFLDKKGFNAYYFDDLPNVKNCDGLWADVETKSNLTRTKMTVVLKDCKGIELYRGEEGSSKHKEYRKSYQEALRKALKSIPVLPDRQTIVLQKEDSPVKNEITAKKEIAEPKAKDLEVVKNVTPVQQYPPQNKFNSYTYNNDSYLLKSIENGFNVYKVSEITDAELELKGAIIKNNSGYTAIVFETQYQCIFQENKDVVLVDLSGKNEGITLTFQN